MDQSLKDLFAIIRPQQVATLLRISPQTVYAWPRVPSGRVWQLSQASGLTPHQLRPDLYAQSDQAAAPDEPSASEFLRRVDVLRITAM